MSNVSSCPLATPAVPFTGLFYEAEGEVPIRERRVDAPRGSLLTHYVFSREDSTISTTHSLPYTVVATCVRWCSTTGAFYDSSPIFISPDDGSLDGSSTISPIVT